MKEQLRILAGAHPMSPQGFERVQGLRRIVYDSGDYKEGIRAFKEKRRPVFTGNDVIGRRGCAAAALWLATGGARRAGDRLLSRGPVAAGGRPRAGRRRRRLPCHARPAEGARHSHGTRCPDEGRGGRRPRRRRPSRLGPDRGPAHQSRRRGLHHAVGADAGARGRRDARRLRRDAAGGRRPGRRRHRLPAQPRRGEGRDRCPQHGRDDGRRVSGATRCAPHRRLGAGGDAGRFRRAAERARARRRGSERFRRSQGCCADAQAEVAARRVPREVTIAATDHYFANAPKELAAAVAAFLGRVFAGRCATS